MKYWEDKINFEEVELLTATFKLSLEDIEDVKSDNIIFINCNYYELSQDQIKLLTPGLNKLTLNKAYSF